MPIYVYECEKCTRQFEYMQSMLEPAKTECEACGGALQKIIAPTAFVLKGGGWGKDLYSSAKKGGGGGGVGESAAPAKTETTKAEPAAKSDSGSSSGAKDSK